MLLPLVAMLVWKQKPGSHYIICQHFLSFIINHLKNLAYPDTTLWYYNNLSRKTILPPQ
jgi:hypothetical protein